VVQPATLGIIVILKSRFLFGGRREQEGKGGEAHREAALLDRYKEALYIGRMEERKQDAQAHFVVDRGADVGADDVFRERGSLRCAPGMLGWLQARK
jgi:hypothetical protein